MTKEEKIKEFWGVVDSEISDDGWLYYGYACNGWDDVENWLKENKFDTNKNNYDMIYDECDNGDLIGIQIRPKSLNGIENNNGWLKLENESDRYPDEDVWVCNYNGNKKAFMHDAMEVIPDKYTHYQPLEKPKSPLHF